VLAWTFPLRVAREMIFRPTDHLGPTLMLPAAVTAFGASPAVDFLPSGRAMLASAVLLGAIHSAIHWRALQEGVNFFSSTMLLD
jgi:hypothetical protein